MKNLAPEEYQRWRNEFAGVQFLFCWSTGHTGTSSLGQMFNTAESFSENELWVPNVQTALPKVKEAYHNQDGRTLWQYIAKHKLPRMKELSRGRRHYLEFGHNSIFGELEALSQLFGSDHTRLVRLRRDHCSVIRSFWYNPAICPNYKEDRRPHSIQFCPGDKGTLWHSEKLRKLWRAGANNKGRGASIVSIWWYIDEVELQWRATRDAFSRSPSSMYPVLEVGWGNSSSFAGVVSQIATFAQVAQPQIVSNTRHHTPAGKKTILPFNPGELLELRAKYLEAMPVKILDQLAVESEQESAAVPVCDFYE
jgi:hypothetical protein